MVMGCYGIGVTRIAAAAIEQNHDADGIIWPVPHRALRGDPAVAAAERRRRWPRPATGSYERAGGGRASRCCTTTATSGPGVKFKDADLIGIPYRIAVGKKGIAEGVVEIKARRSPEVVKVKLDEAVRLRARADRARARRATGRRRA